MTSVLDDVEALDHVRARNQTLDAFTERVGRADEQSLVVPEEKSSGSLAVNHDLVGEVLNARQAIRTFLGRAAEHRQHNDVAELGCLSERTDLPFGTGMTQPSVELRHIAGADMTGGLFEEPAASVCPAGPEPRSDLQRLSLIFLLQP
jgi:hypothetical protein